MARNSVRNEPFSNGNPGRKIHRENHFLYFSLLKIIKRKNIRNVQFMLQWNHNNSLIHFRVCKNTKIRIPSSQTKKKSSLRQKFQIVEIKVLKMKEWNFADKNRK